MTFSASPSVDNAITRPCKRQD